MIEIDKKDSLYKYLLGLGIENPDKLYLELAQNGRYKKEEVQRYLYSTFDPSVTNELDEQELEKVLDYYVDIKKQKPLTEKQLVECLKLYKQNPTNELKTAIIQAKLKDLLMLCLNYKSSHKDVDVQDLVQVANIGLMQALDKYNPSTKIPFKDYIIFWVKQEIKKEFENE